jgi:hypothetical protein
VKIKRSVAIRAARYKFRLTVVFTADFEAFEADWRTCGQLAFFGDLH